MCRDFTPSILILYEWIKRKSRPQTKLFGNESYSGKVTDWLGVRVPLPEPIFQGEIRVEKLLVFGNKDNSK